MVGWVRLALVALFAVLVAVAIVAAAGPFKVPRRAANALFVACLLSLVAGLLLVLVAVFL